jgi:branched-chain amino acid transport system substrate-binding protein
VPGSAEFAARYAERHGPMGNYAVNSYDSARVLLAAIRDAASRHDGPPSRREVIEAMLRIRFKGIAYEAPVRWNEKGDNLAAVTSLNMVEDGRFREVAEIGQSSAPAAA